MPDFTNTESSDMDDVEEVELPDGSVVFRFPGAEIDVSEYAEDEEGDDSDFYDNIADKMDSSDLSRVSMMLLEGVQADIQSRTSWMAQYTRGMGILGIEIKSPRAQADTDGVSTVDHPLLVESCIQYHSNALREFLPSSGPIKIENSGQQGAQQDADAELLERDANTFLMRHSPEYYPQTDRMIFQHGFGGMGYKKIFHCPLRRRPVADAVPAEDFIISVNAESLETAARKTHRVTMQQSTMLRMMHVGAYRNVDLGMPVDEPTLVDRKIAAIDGSADTSTRPEDAEYTVYETYALIDMPGDRHTEDGEASGLPRPYKVVIEKDSRQVLEIRRNWREGDELYAERRVFIAYPFWPMFGFYASGLLQVLGNTTNSLTAAWRMLLDAGMFANFPGFLYLKNGDRQLDNNFRVAPGEGSPIDGNGADDISKVVSPLPYREPGPATTAFVEHIANTGQRLGGMPNQPTAEGRSDAPVGTRLADLEQAARMISAVHARFHQAQSLEFQTLFELVREDPESFLRFFEPLGQWTMERLIAALDNNALVPVADPNTPTHLHRIMKTMALAQRADTKPELYNAMAVERRILAVLGYDDPSELLVAHGAQAPAQGQPDPSLAIAQSVERTKVADIQARERIEGQKGHLALVKLAADKQIAEEKNAVELAKIQADLAKSDAANNMRASGDELKAATTLATAHMQDMRDTTRAAMDDRHRTEDRKAANTQRNTSGEKDAQ